MFPLAAVAAAAVSVLSTLRRRAGMVAAAAVAERGLERAVIWSPGRWGRMQEGHVRPRAGRCSAARARLTGHCVALVAVSRHREVMGLPNMAPAISDNCFIAPSANIVGNVKVPSLHPLASCSVSGPRVLPRLGVLPGGPAAAGTRAGASSCTRRYVCHRRVAAVMSRADCGWPCEQVGSRSNVWYGAILKGDASAITIAANTSIKDRVVIAPSGAGSVTIGSEVLVGQGACIGNATIKDKAVIGMGSTVGDGAVVESGAYVAPGSIVAAGETVPAGKLFSGSAVLRDLTEEESGRLEAAKEALIQLGAKHAEEAYKGFLEIEQDKSDAKWKFDRTLDSDGALGLLEKNPRAQVW